LREYYVGSSSHEITIDLWDYSSSSWETYGDFVGQSGFTYFTSPVFDPSDHISGGTVQLRLHHVQNGVSTHVLYIDFAWLIEGTFISASPNLDGYARYSFGFNNFNGSGNFTTTGTITGIVNYSNVVNFPNSSTQCTGTDKLINITSSNGVIVKEPVTF